MYVRMYVCMHIYVCIYIYIYIYIYEVPAGAGAVDASVIQELAQSTSMIQHYYIVIFICYYNIYIYREREREMYIENTRVLLVLLHTGARAEHQRRHPARAGRHRRPGGRR